jgi:hypothetical protein
VVNGEAILMELDARQSCWVKCLVGGNQGGQVCGMGGSGWGGALSVPKL